MVGRKGFDGKMHERRIFTEREVWVSYTGGIAPCGAGEALAQVPREVWLPLHPWQCQGQAGATWDSGRCPAHGNEMGFEIPANPDLNNPQSKALQRGKENTVQMFLCTREKNKITIYLPASLSSPVWSLSSSGSCPEAEPDPDKSF